MAHLFNPERWVVTGLLWAALAFPLTSVVGWTQGEVPMADGLAFEAGLWVIGGLAFGQTMRFVARRGVGHAG